MAQLELKKKKNIYWAEFNESGTGNPIDFKVAEMLEQLLREIENSNKIRVLVISGLWHGFFSTGDRVSSHSSPPAREKALDFSQKLHDILQPPKAHPFWTLACMNGEVQGAGSEWLLCFDFSIASKTTTFSFAQAPHGLPVSRQGIIRLTERVGRSRALEWLSGQHTISSDEAFQTGLVNRLSITSELRRNTWEWALELSRIDSGRIMELKDYTRKSPDS